MIYKMSLMKKYVLILLSILFVGCTDNDDTISPIVGQWKLTIIEQNNIGGIGLNLDYSADNVIYNFGVNGVVSVSTDNAIHTAGTHTYLYEFNYLSGNPSPGESQIYVVQINNTRWIYNLNANTMSLDNSYVDGPKMYFIRQ